MFASRGGSEVHCRRERARGGGEAFETQDALQAESLQRVPPSALCHEFIASEAESYVNDEARKRGTDEARMLGHTHVHSAGMSIVTNGLSI